MTFLKWITVLFLSCSLSVYSVTQKLKDICIPGTMHSGSYQLYDEFSKHLSYNYTEHWSIIAEENSPENPLEFLRKIHQKQQNTVYQQLRSGIRYVEFYISYQNHGIWRIDHDLLGNLFSQVLYDIKLFAKENPSEILVVNVKHSTKDFLYSEELSKLIMETIGYYIYPYNGIPNPEIEKITRSGRNIIICMPYGYFKYSFAYWSPWIFSSQKYPYLLGNENVFLSEHKDIKKVVNFCKEKNSYKSYQLVNFIDYLFFRPILLRN
jgi:hypothetical protein